ncbi:hypothetical protein JZ751_016346 [Albula glossodonta]|uniref:Uncharacterized protein n=1 Tax=Albula glossodonta TaxID=121402 RepID=A0A8T2MWI0_9TELE|nr:hypothetical protein JZ751_016346 [Albula glossodonta]
MGGHQGHTFCALEDAYQQERAAFEELFKDFKTWSSADILSCLESLEIRKKKALQSVSKDAEKVTDYFNKLISTLDQKKNEIVSDFETMKLMVMQAYDPEINKLSEVLKEQRLALSIAESFRGASDPLTFLQQMQEFRAKLKFVQETSAPSRINIVNPSSVSTVISEVYRFLPAAVDLTDYAVLCWTNYTLIAFP